METPDRKIKLKNLSIYSTIDHLYLNKGDHKLFKVEGEERQLVEKCIEAVKDSTTIGEAFEKVKSDLDGDEDFFLQILEWLDENEVVKLEKTEEETDWEAKTKEVVVVSGALSEEEAKDVIQVLKEKGRNVQLHQYISLKNEKLDEISDEADIILVFSPVFENYQKVYEINKIAYKKGILLLHIGMEQSTVTLGPLVNPKYKTPCLSCYLKRKVTNLANPKDFVHFMEIQDRKALSELRIRENKYFDLMLSMLNLELEKAFIYNALFSPLMGSSLIIDPIGMFMEKSTIIKVSDCDVCGTSSHYYPF